VSHGAHLPRIFNEPIDLLLIENDHAETSLVDKFTEAFPLARRIFFDGNHRARTLADIKTHPKRTLILTGNPGRFIKPFPRHPWYQYDHMFNLILGFNCYASCHYCFIHTYFDDGFPTMYVNETAIHAELISFLHENPNAWISTGEFIDSLQLDTITRHTESIMETMRAFPDSTFELRTKHSRVDHLPICPFDGTLFSFSINPDVVTRKVEAGSSGLDERLSAVTTLLDRGYRIAFRIDPIIATPRYRDAYRAMVDTVEKRVGWRHLDTVFLGALRFGNERMDKLAAGSASRHLLDDEYVMTPDGKYRPYKNARVERYRDLVERIRRTAPDVRVELVMEPNYVSEAVLGSALKETIETISRGEGEAAHQDDGHPREDPRGDSPSGTAHA